MSYNYQTWSYGAVATSAMMQQTEDNVRDHTHGSSGVNADFVSFTGSAFVADVGSINALSVNSVAIGDGTANLTQLTVSSVRALSLSDVVGGQVLSSGSLYACGNAAWVSSRSATGNFVVTHSRGDSNYIVTATPLYPSLSHAIASIQSRQDNLFEIRTESNSVTANMQFFFSVVPLV